MESPVNRFAMDRDEVLGFAVYVSILTGAYYYNVSFIQLGLTELGQESVGLSMESVAAAMGLLAITTLSVTLASGRLMDRFGWGTDLAVKFRVLLGVLFLQIGLTLLSSAVSSFPGFLLWVLACSVPLGAGIPFAFSLMLDLVGPGERGYAAGTVAGLAFFLAALFPFEWSAGNFALPALSVLVPVVGLLCVLSVFPERVGRRYVTPDGGSSRAQRHPAGLISRPLIAGLVLLFGAFFVDSLGFVRIIETPEFVDSAWQSSEYSTRVRIGVTHLLGGVGAGLLYTKARYLSIFVVTFALFATAQFLYVFDTVAGSGSLLGTVTPLVYVLAVSCYTTVTFALWPDLATPETVGTVTAVGVGIGGWMATFTSTALALMADRVQLDIGLHLFTVGVTSVTFLVLTVALWALTDGPDQSETGNR